MLDPKTIRNVAVIAHDGAGKTALTEALLRHEAPARASKDGSTSHLDVDPAEVRRNFTVATHITFAEHEGTRSEEHTSELQSRFDIVCRLLLEKKQITSHTFAATRAT